MRKNLMSSMAMAIGLGLTACSHDALDMGAEHSLPSAIVAGQDAGDRYGNVGAIAVRRLPATSWFGPCTPGAVCNQRCTGTLISPTVVITAGHCVYESELAGTQMGVSFDAVFTASSPVIKGTAFKHPNFVKGSAGNNSQNQYDVGILVLDEPVTTIPPARLPHLGELARIGKHEHKDELLTVGYGVNVQPPPFGVGFGTRRYTTVEMESLTDTKLIVSPAPGRSCLRDSGSPYTQAHGTRTERYLKRILATFYSSDGAGGSVDSRCQDNLQLGWRLDEPSTLAFVRSFVADADHDGDANDEGVADDEGGAGDHDD